MLCFSSTVCFGKARDDWRVLSLSVCYHLVLLLRGAHDTSKVCVYQIWERTSNPLQTQQAKRIGPLQLAVSWYKKTPCRRENCCTGTYKTKKIKTKLLFGCQRCSMTFLCTMWSITAKGLLGPIKSPRKAREVNALFSIPMHSFRSPRFPRVAPTALGTRLA